MKAVLHSGHSPEWVGQLGAYTWGTLPVANRPILEYWLVLCLSRGIQDIWIVLNEGADTVEKCLGQGERIGLNIRYTFIPRNEPSRLFFERTPQAWQQEGLLHVVQPLFPMREQDADDKKLLDGQSFVARDEMGVTAFCCADPEAVEHYVKTGKVAVHERHFTDVGLDMTAIKTMQDYFRINMRLVNGELDRYPLPGYVYRSGASFGYNVITPSSASLQPPLIFGNECRVGRMCEVGPGAIVGNHVVIDQETCLRNCIILDNSYIGPHLDIEGKIVAGSRLADPEKDVVANIDDTWLFSAVRSPLTLRDAWRALVGWLVALCMVLLQALPYGIFHIFWRHAYRQEQVEVLGRGNRLIMMNRLHPQTDSRVVRLAWALLLDRYHAFCQVVSGRLWLCGHRPMAQGNPLYEELPCYFPAALTYADERDLDFPELEQVDDRLYIAQRSLSGDLRLFLRVVIRRWLTWFSGAQSDIKVNDD